MKQATLTTMSPARLGARQSILVEDARRVAEQANWSAWRRPLCHLSTVLGPAGWGGGGEVRTSGIYFRSTGTGWITVLRFMVQVLPEAENITVGARCWFDAASGGDVRITVGGTASTLSFSDSDNGAEVIATLTTAATGTGWLECTVELDQTAGGGTSNYLRDVRVDEQEYPALDAPNE